MKKRALISVSDKTGVEAAAKRLEALGYEIVSTGGTETALKKAGVKTVNISDITGFPECLDGQSKDSASGGARRAFGHALQSGAYGSA